MRVAVVLLVLAAVAYFGYLAVVGGLSALQLI